MKVGSLFGIAITVNVSWIFIFALVTWGLANPMGPLHLEGVGTAERIALGLSAALLFFASVLVHELAHSLLARRRGIAVKGITLFIFGGVSQFDGEAQDAPGEAWISGIGPLTSLLLGGLFYGASLAVGGSATHTGAMFAYLGIANVLLEGRSNLVVVDTQHMEDGAVATVKLPFRLNQGIHGWWVPGDNINDVRGTT